MIEHKFVAQPVELAGGDAGADMGRDKVEGARRQLPGPPHALKGLGAVELDPAVARFAGREAGHGIAL
jgi:hypothetical protein